MSTQRTGVSLRPTGIPLGNPWEAWRLGWMASELWVTSACDLMSRPHGLTRADPARTAAQREWQRRWRRQAMAGFEAAMEVQRAGFNLWLDHLAPRWPVAAPRPPAHARRHQASAAPRPDRRLSPGRSSQPEP